MKHLLFLPVLPAACASWLLGLFSMLVWVAHKPRFEGTVLTLEFRERFATGRDGKGRWAYSTTIIRTIWYQPGWRDATHSEDERIEQHEHVHVRQWEDALAWSALQALVLYAFTHSLLLAACVYASGAVAMGMSYLASAVRYGAAPGSGSWANRVFTSLYYESEMERSAYAQTDEWPEGGSWEGEWRRQRAARRRSE